MTTSKPRSHFQEAVTVSNARTQSWVEVSFSHCLNRDVSGGENTLGTQHLNFLNSSGSRPLPFSFQFDFTFEWVKHAHRTNSKMYRHFRFPLQRQLQWSRPIWIRANMYMIFFPFLFICFKGFQGQWCELFCMRLIDFRLSEGQDACRLCEHEKTTVIGWGVVSSDSVSLKVVAPVGHCSHNGKGLV